MRTATVLIVLALLTFAAPAFADFTVPPPQVWIAVPCGDWNCVMAELTVAGGDPNVIAVPTTSTEYPWIVLERVQAGVIGGETETPWTVEQFTFISDASNRFSAILPNLSPVMVTTTSQGFLIASRNPARRRAASH
jgi:hypothetical protein